MEIPEALSVVDKELRGGEVAEGAGAAEVGGGGAFCGEGAARGLEGDVVPGAARVSNLSFVYESMTVVI